MSPLDPFLMNFNFPFMIFQENKKLYALIDPSELPLFTREQSLWFHWNSALYEYREKERTFDFNKTIIRGRNDTVETLSRNTTG